MQLVHATTHYVWDKNLEFVLTELENHSDIAIKWLKNNYMKMNSDKCHLFNSSHKFEHLSAKIVKMKFGKQELLIITVDNKLKFIEHLRKV